MLDTLEIIDAVSALVSPLPEIEQIYIDLVPKDFHRPCLLIEAVTTTAQTAAANLLRVTEYFTLTIFCETDDQSHTATRDLLLLRQKVLEFFRPGYLRVQDRAITVQASSAGRDYDRAFIDLQFVYHEKKSNAPNTAPVMETLKTTVQQKG